MKAPPPTLPIRIGRIGITIPNPSKSIKTTKSRINIFRLDIKVYSISKLVEASIPKVSVTRALVCYNFNVNNYSLNFWGSSNGRTTDFGSVYHGSNPCPQANNFPSVLANPCFMWRCKNYWGLPDACIHF